MIDTKVYSREELLIAIQADPLRRTYTIQALPEWFDASQPEDEPSAAYPFHLGEWSYSLAMDIRKMLDDGVTRGPRFASHPVWYGSTGGQLAFTYTSHLRAYHGKIQFRCPSQGFEPVTVIRISDDRELVLSYQRAVVRSIHDRTEFSTWKPIPPKNSSGMQEWKCVKNLETFHHHETKYLMEDRFVAFPGYYARSVTSIIREVTARRARTLDEAWAQKLTRVTNSATAGLWGESFSGYSVFHREITDVLKHQRAGGDFILAVKKQLQEIEGLLKRAVDEPDPSEMLQKLTVTLQQVICMNAVIVNTYVKMHKAHVERIGKEIGFDPSELDELIHHSLTRYLEISQDELDSVSKARGDYKKKEGNE